MEKSPLIDFSLSFRYEGSGYDSLSDVEGKIEKGRCIVLCGSSGCGKTTLLRCFNRLIPEFYDGKLTGFCRIEGKNAEELYIGEAGKLSSSVFQDPRSQFFTLSSSNEIAFGLENFGISHSEMIRRVDKAFTDSGLDRLRDRNVFELSSGERQLVALLAAEALDTDILLLDEPTANLDHAAIENLRELLFRLKEKGKTLILSEHRLYYLSGLADEYWRMEKGGIKEKLTGEEMLALSEEELAEKGLRTTDESRTPNREGKKQIPEEAHRFEVKDIAFSYPKTGKIIDGLSLSAETGDVIGIVGPNGSGKTTFGKIVTGLLEASGGSILLDGKKLGTKDLNRESIFIMQEAEFQFFTNSVMNELLYGGKETEERKEEIKELLKDVDMYRSRNQHPFTLSGGQMQKLVLLLAYISQKPVVVLDEPTAGLDRRSLEAVSGIIERMSKKKIVFMITHDTELLALSCTKALSMENGRIKRAYDLTGDKGLSEIKAYMDKGLIPQEREIKREKERKHLLDPRTKFFILLVVMVVAVFTNLRLMCFTMAGVMLAVLYERRWGTMLRGIISMASVFALFHFWPNVGTSFILNFFPRIILLASGMAMIAQKSEASRSLAAMRRMHVPENWIMIFAVVFRFFPVLRKDLGMMKQSIRTRGFFPHFTDRLKSIPRYAEILIVPMVFRVTRIAEALSASAETRGIALRNRRESYIDLKFRPADAAIAVLTVLLVAAGLII